MEDELRAQAEAQGRLAAYNRRVERELENGNRAFAVAGDAGAAIGEFFCTCGRPDCEEILQLSAEEFRFVQERPYRFLVASDHAAEVDEVILRTGEYDVVEVRADYRQAAVDALEAARRARAD